MFSTECIDSYRIKKYNGYAPSSLTYANNKFYMNYPDACVILCFNECFKLQHIHTVNGAYFNMCYDEDHNCFYALDIENTSSIFILNSDFYEMDILSLVPDQDDFPISIAYCNSCIYVAYESYVVCIDEERNQEIILSCNNTLCALDAASSNLVVIETCEPLYNIQFFSCIGECLACKELYIEDQICEVAMIHNHIYFLSKDQDCSFNVLDYTICLETCEHPCESQQACEFFDCGEIEKGIACILNSEGMKIQYAIEKGVSISELLKINQSVTNVINEVTQLELSLYTKLSRIINEDCTSCDDDGECTL